ncbi:MAG: phage portal protein [Candidatus Omnitrophota bacterium]
MKEVKEKKSKKLSEKLSSLVDNVIGIFNPSGAYKRIAYRKSISMLSSYRGADKSRLRSSWLPGSNSADEDLLPELSDLRQRSRDLNRNDAVASGITGTMVTNVIGTGIKPQSRIDKDSLELTDENILNFQKLAERNWERWVPYADAGERLDFYEIQQLADRQILENGEVIILPLMLKDDDERPFSLALDVIESDRLATPSDLTQNKSIRYGVEIGSRGEPIAYHIRKTHPGDLILANSKKRFDNTSKSYIRYPAKNALGRKNILHLYWMNRPGQTRGVPFFAPVLTYFKDLADYLEAELVTARIAACFSIFIKKEDPYAAATARTSSTNSAGQRVEELEPGLIEYLAPGEDISTFNPNRPGGSFEPFVNRILREISAALGLPYELVAKDFSQTNYSSARAALLEARRYFKVRQEWLAKKLCQPVWEMLLEEAFLRNELPASNFYEQRLDWTRARWIAPGWQWVDPVKEAESSRLAIEIGVSSLADEAASQGKDWEETLEQQAREDAKRKELGLEKNNSSEIITKKNEENVEDKEKEIEAAGKVIGELFNEQIRGLITQA